MEKIIKITKDQLQCLKQVQLGGKCIIKHLPDSSVFKAKVGSWKTYWESVTRRPWPSAKDENNEYVGSHVVDIFTKEVFICPRLNSENVGVVGREDDSIFSEDKSLMVPFRLEDSYYDGDEVSPEAHLQKALSKLTFL